MIEKESKKKKIVLDNFVLASPQSGLTVYDPMKTEKTFEVTCMLALLREQYNKLTCIRNKIAN